MKNAVRQYNFMKKDSALIKCSNWFKGAEDGFLNGSNDLKSMGLTVLKIKAVSPKGYGERLPSVWLKRFSPSEKNWSLIRLVALPSPALEQRLSIGNLNKERFIIFQLSLLLLIFSLVTERQVKLSRKEIAIISLILTLKQKRWETSIRQTLLDQGTSEAAKVLPDSILSILWMWQGIQPLQVSLLINKPSLSANIWLRHGDLWAFPQYPRWIMRWLLQVEGVILISFLRLFACTCSWGYIWYLSHRENPAGMPLLRVSTPSGKKERFIGITALPLLSLEKPANNSCNIIIMRNLTEVLLKKNMAQDSLECLKTTSGNPLFICQRVLALIDTLTLTDTLISLLRREKSPSSEKLTLRGELRSMVLPISSGENLRDNMLLLLSLLIEKDWLLNKKIELSNLFLFQLMVILLILWLSIKREKLNLSIRCY